MRDPARGTRERLVAAAERLFAERGVDAVSMNEVLRAAGARNKSALTYHFGSKDGLLQAILDKHVPGIELRRHRWLDDIEARGDHDVRELMKALVVPVLEKLDDPDGGRAYVAIAAELIGGPRSIVTSEDAFRVNRGAERLHRMLERVCSPLPDPVRIARYVLVTELLFHGISDFGRLSSTDPPLLAPESRAVFVSNLVDVLAAVATADVSHETQALLAPRGGAP